MRKTNSNRQLVIRRKRAGTVFFRAGFILSLAALFSPAFCAAQAQSGGAASATDTSAFSSSEIDDLAAKLAAQLAKKKIKSVVVVGVFGPKKQITELGVSVLNSLSDAMTRQAGTVTVYGINAVRDFLGQNRVAEDMVYSDTLATWITTHLKAQAFVTANLDPPSNKTSTLSVQLAVAFGSDYVRDISVKTSLPLTDLQLQRAQRDYFPALKIPFAQFKSPGYTNVECISCPRPEYSEQARKAGINGTTKFQATVRPDGMLDDILVTEPLGAGLDGAAVDSLLTWKLKPSTDPQGHPVAMQIPIEVTFVLYTKTMY